MCDTGSFGGASAGLGAGNFGFWVVFGFFPVVTVRYKIKENISWDKA